MLQTGAVYKERGREKQQKEPTPPSTKQLCILTFTITSTPPPHQQGKMGKKRERAEQRSNFKCNSATTPINLNLFLGDATVCILQADSESSKCCVDFTQYEPFVQLVCGMLLLLVPFIRCFFRLTFQFPGKRSSTAALLFHRRSCMKDLRD